MSNFNVTDQKDAIIHVAEKEQQHVQQIQQQSQQTANREKVEQEKDQAIQEKKSGHSRTAAWDE